VSVAVAAVSSGAFEASSAGGGASVFSEAFSVTPASLAPFSGVWSAGCFGAGLSDLPLPTSPSLPGYQAKR